MKPPQPRAEYSTRVGPGPLRMAWVEMLDRVQYPYFHSHTFDRWQDHSPGYVERRIKAYCRRASDVIFGSHRDLGSNPGLGMVYALEPHGDGRLHWHGLSFHPSFQKDCKATRHLLNNLWNIGRFAHPRGLHEGYCRVLPCQITASRYVSKYVVKGGDIWIDDVLAWWATKGRDQQWLSIAS